MTMWLTMSMASNLPAHWIVGHPWNLMSHRPLYSTSTAVQMMFWTLGHAQDLMSHQPHTDPEPSSTGLPP